MNIAGATKQFAILPKVPAVGGPAVPPGTAPKFKFFRVLEKPAIIINGGLFMCGWAFSNLQRGIEDQVGAAFGVQAELDMTIREQHFHAAAMSLLSNFCDLPKVTNKFDIAVTCQNRR